MKPLTDIYTTLRDLYSHSWCLFFENVLTFLLYSSNVFRQSNFVLGVIKFHSLYPTQHLHHSLADTFNTPTTLTTRPWLHTYTITHPTCNTTDAIDVHTPSNVLYCSFLQYSSSRGGLFIRAIGATHCLRPTGKGFFFLSDSTTRPSDLPLNVIAESANSHSGNSQTNVVLQMTPPLFGAKWKSPQISLIDSHVKSIFNI